MGVMVAQKGFIETAENGDRFVVLLERPALRGHARVRSTTAPWTSTATRCASSRARPSARRRTNKAKSTLDLLQRAHSAAALAELHWRVALPLAVLIMGLFAIPLAFVNPRSGRSWNLILAVLVYALYNNLLSIFQAWTAQGKIPAWLGLWPVHGAMIADPGDPLLAAARSRFRKIALGR